MSQNSDSPTKSSNSSLSSSERFGLDPNDTSRILVYTYRRGVRPSSQKDLCKNLDSGMTSSRTVLGDSRPEEPMLQTGTPQNTDNTTTSDPKLPFLRCSRLPIPRGRSRVDVRQEDLYSEDERQRWASLPNAQNNLASVVLKRGWYFARLLKGTYKDMYILSEETTPESSPENSQVGSIPNSRNQTFES